MSIVIDKAKCKACGACGQVCPGTLIHQREDGKAYIKYPRDCWGCSSCIKECHFGAIALYLGADIGGMGSRMTAFSKGNELIWTLDKWDGTQEQIVIDKTESNKY